MKPELHITGLVSRPRRIEWRQLEQVVGGLDESAALERGVIGEAVPVASLLEQSGPLAEATHGTVVGGDGGYTASIPLEDLKAGGWLVYRLDGNPLPVEKGGPLRLNVVQGSTLCWNVKDVTEISLTASKEPDSVPDKPAH